MRLGSVLVSVGLLLASSVGAQFKEGKQLIEKMCGCYEVSFQYAETFAADTSYKFHAREKTKALEWVTPAYEGNTIVLQHILVINDSTIIKHWRQDWEYEAKEALTFVGNKEWRKTAVSSPKKTWTQTVWEVDDAPRYQGTSTWVTTPQQTFWYNVTDAPLPRREYTKRNDYQILRRGNKIYMNETGWVHEQDNEKIRTTGNIRETIAHEKGLNDYKKISDSKCAQAQVWWQQNAPFWKTVRQQWMQKIKAGNGVKLQPKVEGKRMDEYFTTHWKLWQQGKATAANTQEAIGKTIDLFLQETPSSSITAQAR
ncbi:MAG: hypothetical protein EAZ47_10280 [Bacteroidetes bacterium]|nr:MAG: hypothetical protein EAY68_00905 [Bacteroidota bacterium]TAF91136.1 MAG: hypothetical protein EAZ47_10280 [Bacteroidota bacterium]